MRCTIQGSSSVEALGVSSSERPKVVSKVVSGRAVALKIINFRNQSVGCLTPTRGVGKDQVTQGQIGMECKIHRGICHENIVELNRVVLCTENWKLYIEVELVEGLPILTWVPSLNAFRPNILKSFAPGMIVDFSKQLARAVEYCWLRSAQQEYCSHGYQA